ncbi:hypothetical protein DSO57_1028104 [Entomophthora muscae]|uniref:Uncharacterized protein n=1 Tax=Entomophthora muscae TaxID=34485 RepID=A0ACC2SQT1_9FUNG|nr:hypothetical protein DSO57_1028104 [Entomophthora muscae]
MNLNSHTTQDCSLWLLLGALVMVLNAFPTFSPKYLSLEASYNSHSSPVLDDILDVSGSAQDLLVTSENLIKSLTCNDLEVFFLKTDLQTPQKLDPSKPSHSMKPKHNVPEEEFNPPEYAPKRTPWLLDGILLMGLDSYFPQLSSASLLWTPL